MVAPSSALSPKHLPSSRITVGSNHWWVGHDDGMRSPLTRRLRLAASSKERVSTSQPIYVLSMHRVQKSTRATDAIRVRLRLRSRSSPHFRYSVVLSCGWNLPPFLRESGAACQRGTSSHPEHVGASSILEVTLSNSTELDKPFLPCTPRQNVVGSVFDRRLPNLLRCARSTQTHMETHTHTPSDTQTTTIVIHRDTYIYANVRVQMYTHPNTHAQTRGVIHTHKQPQTSSHARTRTHT